MKYKGWLSMLGAFLAAAVAWQQLGLPLPATTQALAQVEAKADKTTLTVLYLQLFNARDRLASAKAKGNNDLVREIERQILELQRKIAELEKA